MLSKTKSDECVKEVLFLLFCMDTTIMTKQFIWSKKVRCSLKIKATLQAE